MVDTAMTGFIVKLNGTELGVDSEAMPLVGITVEQSTRLPDLFTIEILDDGFGQLDSDTFQVGAEVEISLYGAGDPAVVTAGEVTALVHDGRRLLVQGFDPGHRLHRGPKTRTFVQMTDSDIATKIAREYSLTPDIDGSSEVYDYVIQFSESDYSFLKSRAERIGFDVWVAEDVLSFKEKPESSTTADLVWKDNLLDLRVRLTSAERADEVVVRGWNYLAKEPVEGRASDRDTGSTASASDDLASQGRQAFGNITRVLSTQSFSSQAEADQLAVSLSLLASGGEVTLRGLTHGNPFVKAGGTVNIQGAGSRLSGDYLVTEVVHTVTDRGYRTRFVAGPKDSAGLTDLLGGRRASSSSTVAGSSAMPVFGKVTDNADPESTGRVKVEFGHLTGTESAWAPVVSPGAGAERGVQFLPEIGDQVVVIFEQGDPSRPIVIGGVWSSQDTPAEPSATSNGNVNLRTLRSREGHRLTFDDEGAGVVMLSLNDDSCSLHLEGQESKFIGDRKLAIEANEIEVVAGGKLTLKGNQIEIAAAADVKVSGATIQLN